MGQGPTATSVSGSAPPRGQRARLTQSPAVDVQDSRGTSRVWVDDGRSRGFGFLRRLPSRACPNLPLVCTQGLPATTNQQPGPRAPAPRKRKSIYDTVTDTQMVEQVFGFLPSMIGGQEGQTPARFEVRWALSFKVHLGQARPTQSRPVDLWAH